MKAYSSINSTIYTSDTDKVMTTLNKMSKGRGVSFSEMWYDKMADTSVANSEKTFDKFVSNFESTFFPYTTLFRSISFRPSYPGVGPTTLEPFRTEH